MCVEVGGCDASGSPEDQGQSLGFVEGQLQVASRVKPVRCVIRLVWFIEDQMRNRVLDYLQKFNYSQHKIAVVQS